MRKQYALSVQMTGSMVGRLDVHLEHVKGWPPWWRGPRDWIGDKSYLWIRAGLLELLYEFAKPGVAYRTGSQAEADA